MKYHIITFGCQMNKNDSERIESVLLSAGMEKAGGPEDADLIILNSCSVRNASEQRVIGLVHNFNELKKQNPNLKIAVTGCMPGRDKDGALKKRFAGVDFYFPIFDVLKLPGLLRRSYLAPRNDDYLSIMPHRDVKYKAFVTIQTGCEEFCTYCVVPYARGPVVNRPMKDVLGEIRDLAQDECLEVTLLGQIVNKHHDFAELLQRINEIEGIKRVTWTAPHPIYMTDEIIDALNLPKQVNYLHLPVQSGSDEILRKMNRKHGRDFYINLIKKIRAKRPDIAIGTDIIVGFCGETEEQFQETVDLYKQCDFDIAYLAEYSTRSGTAADKAFKDDVPQKEKKRRWQVLQDLMEETTLRKNQKYVGQTVSVLVDKCEDGACVGNSSEMKVVSFSGDESLIGKVISVKIIEAKEWILYGRNQAIVKSCSFGRSDSQWKERLGS